MPERTKTVIQFPYRRSLGPVVGAFMSALTERRIVGIRCGDRVLVPPIEWDPVTAETLEPDFVDVGPAGAVESWTWVAEPSTQHPLRHPFAFALIRLDGADTGLVHAVDAGSPQAMANGMRVAPRWRAARVGRIDDIECFVPGETPVVPADDQGPAAEAVEMMDAAAAIEYEQVVPPNSLHVVAASAEGKLLGHRCPVCGRVYTGGRGMCSVDGVELGEEHEVDLPQTGVVTNYTIVTPVQYPGQTETEPFSRVMVLLDAPTPGGDRDVILSYQEVLDIPVDTLHPGIRVRARWNTLDDGPNQGGGFGGASGYLAGWEPTGEPDDTTPGLMDRIF